MAEVWRFFAHEDDFADLDETGACERLGRVLSFPTISSMDAEAVDWQPFDDLRAYMEQAWPHVFAAGEVELIDHSLLVTLSGSDPALKPVMLMGHMDVVPVVPGTEADWTHDPFSGHVDDTYIWGRGAIDMKDQVAGILEAVEYALAHGWQHERTLLLAFGQDEETTQYGAGAIGRVLEERGVELEYLIDEGDYRIVSAAEYGAGEGWLMHADLAEKGYADIVLKTKSEGGHSSNPYGGTSLEVLSRAIAAICDIEWPTRVTDLLAAQLVELGFYTADEIAANGDVIVRDCLASKKLYPLVTTTCAPTQIEGGSTGANVMPQDMWANINFRMLEGTGVADVVTCCREAVAAAGLAGREVTAALESVVEPISLEEPVYTDGGDAMYVIDQVRDPDGEDSWISGLQFRQTVAGLTPREKRIMELRYLQGKTQMEVAREIGISQAQVSRLEKGALSQFRTRD